MEVMVKVLEAFTYVADHSIIHRNIKPPNILIDLDSEGSNHTVSVVGWGEAKFLEKNGHRLEGREYVPAEGSFPFAAPEVYLLGYENCNLSADVWAFGATLAKVSADIILVHDFEMKNHFREDNPTLFYEYLRNVFEDGRHIRLQLDLSKISGNFTKALILDALRFNPLERPTMAEMLQEVRNFLVDPTYEYRRRVFEVNVQPKDQTQVETALGLLAFLGEDTQLKSSELP